MEKKLVHQPASQLRSA